MVVQLNGLSFKNQKLAKDYVRALFTKIGITESVKSISLESFNNILGICQSHPDSVAELEGIKDFIIRKNPLNQREYALYILKKDNSVLDISWNYCITKKKKDYLTQALRESIHPQILEFKNENATEICSMCQCELNGNFHIDHILQFNIIVKRFLLYKN